MEVAHERGTGLKHQNPDVPSINGKTAQYSTYVILALYSSLCHLIKLYKSADSWFVLKLHSYIKGTNSETMIVVVLLLRAIYDVDNRWMRLEGVYSDSENRRWPRL